MSRAWRWPSWPTPSPSGSPGCRVRDALAAVADAHRDYARAHPGRWQATRHRVDHATALAGAGPRLAGLMRAVLRGYGLAEPDTTHAVRLLGATVAGFVDLEAAGGFAHSGPTSPTPTRPGPGPSTPSTAP